MVAAVESQALLQQDGSGDLLPSPIDESTADVILRKTQYLYALILLVTFIGLAAWYSVFNAKKEEDVVQPTVKGPGGKPLPITKLKKRDNGERKIGPHFGRTAKNVFRYLAAMVFLSYLGNGISMFIHAFWYEDPYQWSKEGLPWAGEWTVVSDSLCTPCHLSSLRCSVVTSYANSTST